MEDPATSRIPSSISTEGGELEQRGISEKVKSGETEIASGDSSENTSENMLGSKKTKESPENRESQDAEDNGHKKVVANMEEIGLKALHVDDDPTLNPWTVRMFVIGIGLSVFGSTLATIFMFKPQSVSVSSIFLAVISHVMGNAMSMFLPRTGRIGRWLNPHDFNAKEHLAIIIMSGTASGAATATEVLATQKLYYNVIPGWFMAILLVFSSQLLGYGMAGVLRKSLVYPTKMIWPSLLPMSTLVETLHRERADDVTTKKKWKLFWLVFLVVTVWELFPQYVMPVLTGISVFCLANQKSILFTRLFGGSQGNEGLGLLALCFDWQYVTTQSFYMPLITQVNGFMGYVGCIALTMALYYGNVWNALSFPFLSQSLFSLERSNATHYEVYNQSRILNSNLELDMGKLEAEGIPFFAASNASYTLTTNLAIGATLVHIWLWHRNSVQDAIHFRREDFAGIWRLIRNPPSLFRRPEPLSEERKQQLDPHYRLMLAYDEVPQWWYVTLLMVSVIVGLVCIYVLDSTLPWWGFLIANALSFLGTLFFGALVGLIGFFVPISPVIQLIGGYLHPGKPVANMYFVLFGSNSQIIGTLIGAVINYVVMNSITTNQRDILLSIEGTNIWSGQTIQSFNSNSIAFGALSKYMFSAGRPYIWLVLALPLGLLIPLPFWLLHKRFPKAGLDYIVTPVILWNLGFLCVGINSSVMITFVLGFYIQFWVRKRHPEWFLKYNYVLAAAISGGTELLVFITTFAVQGASGKAIPFPPYWGNNYQSGNYDFCMTDPRLGR